MTNAELIAELRYCAEHEGCDYYIAKDCPREYTWVCGADCEKILMHAAADALEAQQKALDECAKQLADMAARLPKEGEWIYTPLEQRYKEYKVKCPFCGAEYHDCYDGYIDAEDMNYCPNCGARMRS